MTDMQSSAQLNQDTKKPEKKNYSIGIDLGTSKATISRSDLSKSSVCPEIVADMMDIRNIPNHTMFSGGNGQLRVFGNNASAHRSFVAPNHVANVEDDLTEKHDVNIGTKQYRLPLYIIRTMIMRHIRKIIDLRTELCSELCSEKDGLQGNTCSVIVIVPSYSSTAKNIFFESMGSMLCLTANDQNRDHRPPRVKTISCVNALIFSYLERHILCVDPKDDIPNKHVMVIDMGQSKTQFFVFSIHRTQGEVFINHLAQCSPEKLSGEHIDDLFVDYMAIRVRETFPKFRINKSNDKDYQNNRFFRASVMKLKHQLSINQSVTFTLLGIDEDIMFQVTRKEFDDVIRSNELETLIKHSVTYFREALDDAPLDHVEIVGGCSRIPIFKDNIKNIFKNVNIGTMNVDESVANGACVYGWLLENKNVAKTIHFIRSVRNPVTIRYPVCKTKASSVKTRGRTTDIEKTVKKRITTRKKINQVSEKEYHDIVVYDHCDKIFTTFSRSKKRSEKFDVDGNKKDVVVTRLPVSDEIDINVGNLRMRLVLHDISNGYIDLSLGYGMGDMVEIINVKDSDGVRVEYDALIQDSDEDSKIDTLFTSLISKYTNIERQIITSEDMIERRQKFTNFMESYYLDKEGVNSLIEQIARDQIEKRICVDQIVHSVDDVPVLPLVSPLKEVYEFYHFCGDYCDELSDAKKSQIENILNDDHSLKQMEMAAQIITAIKSTYQG